MNLVKKGAKNALKITIDNTFIIKTNLQIVFGWLLISKFVICLKIETFKRKP